MAKIINYLLSYTKLGQLLNGKKTIIGAALIVLVGLIELIEKIAPMFPEASYLPAAVVSLKELLDQLQTVLGYVGLGSLGVGVTHKIAKSKLDK